MSARWSARIIAGTLVAAVCVVLLLLESFGVALYNVQMVLGAVAGFIEVLRRDSLLPWWSLGAHSFSAGFAYLARGPEGPMESMFGLGLCALGAPLLFKIYRNRHRRLEREMDQLKAELAEIEKQSDEKERREDGGS